MWYFPQFIDWPVKHPGTPVEPTSDIDDICIKFEQEVEEPADPEPPNNLGRKTKHFSNMFFYTRSGEKGSDCKVGFYARHVDEWPWLHSFLSVDRVKLLLQNDYNGKRIERFELLNILAVHFLLKNHLDGGVSPSSAYDVLEKNVAENLRAKTCADSDPVFRVWQDLSIWPCHSKTIWRIIRQCIAVMVSDRNTKCH